MTTPTGSASDTLAAQVTIDNVLAVGAALRTQRDRLPRILDDARYDLRIGRMGEDPVSKHFTPIFQRRTTEIADVHARHVEELTEAVDRLDTAAREYRISEDEITRTFRT